MVNACNIHAHHMYNHLGMHYVSVFLMGLSFFCCNFALPTFYSVLTLHYRHCKDSLAGLPFFLSILLLQLCINDSSTVCSICVQLPCHNFRGNLALRSCNPNATLHYRPCSWTAPFWNSSAMPSAGRSWHLSGTAPIPPNSHVMLPIGSVPNHLYPARIS